MSSSVYSNIIADLRKVATVGVATDGDMPAGVHRSNIVIESTEMHKVVANYDSICTIAHKSWSNLS